MYAAEHDRLTEDTSYTLYNIKTIDHITNGLKCKHDADETITQALTLTLTQLYFACCMIHRCANPLSTLWSKAVQTMLQHVSCELSGYVWHV